MLEALFALLALGAYACPGFLPRVVLCDAWK